MMSYENVVEGGQESIDKKPLPRSFSTEIKR